MEIVWLNGEVKALLFAGGCPKAIFSAPDLGKCQRSHYDLTEGLMSSDVFHADLQQKVPPTQRIDLREIRHPRDFTPEPCGLQPRMFRSAKSNYICYQKKFSMLLALPLQMNTEQNTR